VVAAGDGAKFPAVPFNATVWPAGAQPTTANAEIVRVTARATDTLTIARAQEGTTARSIVVGDQIAATVTAKTLQDVEAIGWKVNRSAAQSINNDTNTPVDFTAEVFDDDDFHSLVTADERITFDADNAGRYAMEVTADFAFHATGFRRVFIRLNGATTIAGAIATIMAVTTDQIGTIVNVSCEHEFVAGDYVEVLVRHLAGTAINLTNCHFSGHRVRK
jgi:hypothetical protein